MTRFFAGLGLATMLLMATPLSGEELAQKTLRVAIGVAEVNQPARWRELRNQLEQAIQGGAGVLLFDINVPEGSGLAGLPVAEEVARLKAHTIAYVNSAAIGAGALFAVACDEIWVGPGSRIGAVPPLVSTDKEEAGAIQETVLADALARLKAGARGLAKLKGHRTDVVEAFVDRSLGFEAGGKVLARPGELLMLDGDDAVLKADGKPLLAKGAALDVAALVKAAGGKPLIDLTPSLLSAAAAPAAAKPEPAAAASRKRIAYPEGYGGKVVVIKVGEEDLMTRARFEFMARTLKRATAEEAEAVIFDLDTPGGLAWDTTKLMMQDLQKLRPPSYAFVNPRAISAGAMIAIATNEIYMSPASSIGAATPVSGNGMELGEAERAKIDSAMMSMARTVAKEKGHDFHIIEAMIDREQELIVNGETLSPKGKLLTLDAEQAVMLVNGRPLLAKAIVHSLDDIKRAEKLGGETVVAEPTLFEHVAIWVTSYAAILILIGVAGGYLELQTPGFGIPGLVSIAAFALFFFGHYVAGSLVGREAVVAALLFVVGVMLLVLEFTVFTGTILPGIVGLIFVMAALVYTMAAWTVPAPSEGEALPIDFSLYALGLRNFMLGVVGAAVVIALVSRFLPESRLFKRLVLTESAGGVLETTPVGIAARQVKAGDAGQTLTAMRPYGTVEIGANRVEAVTEGAYLQAGTAVRVREINGTRIIVEEVAV